MQESGPRILTNDLTSLAPPLKLSYSFGLVAVSVLLSMAAAYSAFALSDRMRFAEDRNLRMRWLAGGSAAMGVGIWSMHYLGMLAVRLPVPVSYNVPIVALSLLMAIAASAVALSIVSRNETGWKHLVGGGILMGVGIGGMHYTGMAAMRSTAMDVYSTDMVVFSILAAILLSTISLNVAFSARERTSSLGREEMVAGMWMGLAIASMHYIAMSATSFIPGSMPFNLDHTVHIEMLGQICIGVTATLLIAVALLSAAYDRQRSLQLRDAAVANELRERYRLATCSNQDGIWDWNRVSGRTYFSARWQEILGLPATDYTGDITHWHQRLHPRDQERATLDFHTFSTGGEHVFLYEYRMRHEDGLWRWFSSRGTAVCDEDGHILRMAGAIADITRRKLIDPLTGLHNRESLLERIEQMSFDRPGSGFALLFVDLDDFKRINESFGQSVGDIVLIEVANRLKQTSPETDGNMVARIAGDEFVILMAQAKDVTATENYASFLQMILKEPIRYDSQELSVSASIGIAFGGLSSSSPKSILEDADVAMYQAKAGGKAKFAIFTEVMREQTKQRLELEADLRQAILKDQLILYYQPKVILATGEVMGFEALARWIHPDRGMISPSDFIPCAEDSGLILEIGRWTMREATHQLNLWRSAGLVSSTVSMSVNLSTRQFEDKTLLAQVRHDLQHSELPPECLTLEITESALIGNDIAAKEILTELREIGVGLDLDDFGTGFSSLSYLHRFPFHSIKIDQSFVLDLERSQESWAITRSILQLGASLNMSVIAEGVETMGQAAILVKLGCVYGQGYFYSRPIPPQDIELMLQTSAASSLLPQTSSQQSA
jgi:diguanylate cyclase (GGDEF)-like protein/PAS domain S-box-containing protein